MLEDQFLQITIYYSLQWTCDIRQRSAEFYFLLYIYQSVGTTGEKEFLPKYMEVQKNASQ